MANQRFAANERNVQRAMAAHQMENGFDEHIAAKITQVTESDFAAEMIIAIGITSGTA